MRDPTSDVPRRGWYALGLLFVVYTVNLVDRQILSVLLEPIKAERAGPTYAAVQGLAPLRMRATAAALLLFLLNFIGMGLGPLIVGTLNDWLEPQLGLQAIRYSLSLVALVKAWGALHSWLASRALRAELEAARG
jgi:hypothetical protein